MQRSLFLVYALLLTVTGALDSDDSKSVSAVAGGAVLLPCHTDDSHDKLTVEWSKEGPPEVTVFLLRKGCENHEEKNPAYEFRTNLIMSELKNGNISLRISNVQLSDEGRYICKTIKGSSNGPQREGVILLTVVAASEPKLSVVPDGGGGVTLQCDAGCWFPKPEITFLDDHGNKISVDDPKEEFNYGGCFNITRRATLPTAVNRVACWVNLPNMRRVAEIHIPDGCMRSCTVPVIIAVFVPLMVLCVACLAYFCKNRLGCLKGPILPQLFNETTKSRNGADFHPPENQAEDVDPREELLRTIEDLNQRLLGKDEKIKQLTQQLHELTSGQTLDVQSSHSQESVRAPPSSEGSVPDVSTNSCPSLLDDDVVLPSPSPALPPTDFRPKSSSLSSSSRKPQRRHTISPVSRNRFSLSKLSEDGEQLLSTEKSD
ncbi:putative butyrophilin subfamily 2 member A3 isoform X2 [Notolabrus celidotus]|uniref:putative butyrophilin subfamily 2 member A3 isoform X2 n=1 Tax=Notolabrus celidotus TaxID=1203425 RepID=UPI00148F74C9|nr:putative butyrophilin subfamily 2 member A3 isoform X2 [Notolabrus celidotus]